MPIIAKIRNIDVIEPAHFAPVAAYVEEAEASFLQLAYTTETPK